MSQSFDAKAELNERTIHLDMMELIALRSGKGDITGSVSFDGEEGLEEYDYGISYNTDFYDDCDVENVGIQYRESLPAALADALIPVLARSEAIISGFSLACFSGLNDAGEPLLRLPLAQLGKKLLEEKCPLDFHRMVLDMDYRSQLLADCHDKQTK